MGKNSSSTDDDSRIDLEDRDPHHLNEHVEISWHDVIGEPGGVRSPECAWRLSNHCFRLSRNCCYILLSVIVAPVVALFLGLTFACLAFEHIWCIIPCLRVWRILCLATRNFCSALVQGIVRPCTESFGYCLYNIRVFRDKLPENMNNHKDNIQVV